jgi:hypothetical protein
MKSGWLNVFRRNKAEQVMGHRIAEPRPTLWAVFWVIVYLIVPVMALGTVVDLLVQWITGHCTGLWCLF